MFANCPQFTNLEFGAENDLVLARGRLSTVHGAHERWIEERSLGYLISNHCFVEGRWLEAGKTWRFGMFEPEKFLEQLTVGETYAAVDGYWGERAWMTLTNELNWRKVSYVAPPHDDHEHCYFCWKTISERKNTVHYLAGKYSILCIECYENTVAKRDIASLHPCFRTK